MNSQRFQEIQNYIISNALDEQIPEHKNNITEHFNLSQQETDEFFSWGPLIPLFADDAVTEILVNGHKDIWLEKNGNLFKYHSVFGCEQTLKKQVRRLLSEKNKKLDQQNPFVDVTLSDGTRAHLVCSPVTKHGICISFRKFKKTPWQISDLIEKGMCTAAQADILRGLVDAKKSIFISGGTGSGKTSLLSALINLCPSHQRIIALEDLAEIKSNHPQFLSLEGRPPCNEGATEVNITRLLKESLRMRPDRIIVGECRGSEALDLLMALNTGHLGSMATIHANSPREALSRLKTLALMAMKNLTEESVCQLINGAINVIVQVERSETRRIVNICELKGYDSGSFLLKEIT